MAKQYGLIKPGSSNQISGLVARPSIFDESDSDEEQIKKKAPVITARTTLKRQDKITQEKALAEDPTVFQYDEVYDDIESKRKESKLARKDIDRKPKYINNLLKTAERRKRENELRIERQVHKEREEEGDEFKDKEEFITTAYRKKLEELRELEEQEKREDYLESIGDVTKQKDLGGFYRHLYEQQLKEKDEIKDYEKMKTLSKVVEEPKDDTKKNKKRKYRKRRSNSKSDNDSNDEDGKKKPEHLPSNLDADSDFSIDSSDSENENTEPKEIKKTKVDEVVIKEEIKDDEIKKEEQPESVVKKEEVPLEFEPDEKVEPKVKIDIWKKRTVGEVFDQALERYYQRKAERNGSH